MSTVVFPFGEEAVARDGGLFFVFEMANNHQGQVEHALAIIQGMAKIAKSCGVDAAIKFQFRRLETFLHPGFFQSRLPKPSNKHVKRFIETQLQFADYQRLADEARKAGLIPFATPFDEASVDWCERLEFPVIKIASCSATDWPLLRRVAQSRRPVLCSTAGLNLAQIDEVVTFFMEQEVSLALMHCVAVYPTPREQVEMVKVKQLRDRFPQLVIGYSGHESPADLDVAGVAVATGAAILERHVGIPTDQIALNAYSLSPADTEKWVHAALNAHRVLGFGVDRIQAREEAESLNALKRGIYVQVDKAPGEFLQLEDLILAMPCLPGQFDAAEIDEVVGLPVPHTGIKAMMPVMRNGNGKVPPEIHISHIVDKTRKILEEAKITLTEGTAAEISHPYGLERFSKQGAIIIDVVNREYCKKLIVQLPGQEHPLHKHIQKEETFQVLLGEVEAIVEGEVKHLQPGESLTIHRGRMHGFRTKTGMVMEEISTTHIKGDSEYEDTSIPSDPTSRKSPIVV